MFELVIKAGLWLACGMIACIMFVLADKKEKGHTTITIVELIVVACGPISLVFMFLFLLTKINIR